MSDAASTTFAQDRRQYDVVAGFLVLVGALAAWRAQEQLPVVAVLVGLGTLAAAAIYVRERRKPGASLTVSAERLIYGHPGRPPEAILDAADGTALVAWIRPDPAPQQ